MKHILHAHYIGLGARGDGCRYSVTTLLSKEFFVWVLGLFKPLAPKSQVAHQLAKGAKDKTQTQGDEEYRERED